MRSLKTDFDGTLAAMAEVEDRCGDSWLTRQLESLESCDRSLTIAGALDHIERMEWYRDEDLRGVEEEPEHADWWRDQAEEKLLSLDIVYGDGGWNRWGVRGDGEVLFSRMHSRGSYEKFSSDTDRVISLGFETW